MHHKHYPGVSMVTFYRLVHKSLTWFCIIALWGLAALTRPAGAAEPPLLFSPVSGQTVSAHAGEREGSLYPRERTATLDQNILFGTRSVGDGSLAPGGAVRFNLFDDVFLDITPLKQERVNRGRTRIWVGRIFGQEHSEAILAVTGDGVAGNIRTSTGEIFQIRHVTGPVHLVRQVDGTQFPPDLPPLPGPLPGQALAGTSAPEVTSAATIPDNGSLLDVMVLYTPSARQAVGGTDNMLNLIQLAVAETNQGYANSQVIQRLRLVHTYEVNYTEVLNDSGYSTALEQVRSTSDGYMDEIHGLRDEYGADLVSLWINNFLSGGLGYIMTSTEWDFSSHAFTVCNYSKATGNYAFAHELGHNQGCQHNRNTDPSAGVFPYSHGYQQTEADPRFQTIMAYDCSGCIRLNGWSNPEVLVGGFPTGIVSTAEDSADNRLSLNNTRTIAANWRQTMVPVIKPYLPWLLLLD